MLRHLIAAALTSVAFAIGCARAKLRQAWQGTWHELAGLGNAVLWAVVCAGTAVYAHMFSLEAHSDSDLGMLWRLAALLVLMELATLAGRASSMLKPGYLWLAWLATGFVLTEWFVVVLNF